MKKPATYSPGLMAAMVLCLLALLPVGQARAAPPAEAQPILTVPEVVVGMKGYGMTVFHGTEIEPFSVEVVSINANETPGMSVIWVRCTDERMIHTGPVQGMSGSPIYLWDDDSGDHVLGEGGKLIGAFAFGYGSTNECVVGVQPIEHMRAVGQRATAEDRPQLSYRPRAGSGLALMDGLVQAGGTLGFDTYQMARLEFTRDLFEHITPASARQARRLPAGPDGRGLATRMMVPMSVANRDIATLLAPSLEPMGIAPFAADPQALGGTPPRGFEVEGLELAPGSALVTPFATGDADLMGIGTVTDVLPDGTVLGFGHAMDGIGVTAVPMATGYVHFIVSLRTISYKRGGTLAIAGTLMQDEQAGVAGTPEHDYITAPVKVTVNIEGLPAREYNYEVLNHPTLTAQIAAAVVQQSITAVQGPPMEHTVRVNGSASFSGGRSIGLNTQAVNGGANAAAAMVAQLVGAITQNPFEEVTLEGLELTVDMDYGLDVYEILSARADRTAAAPGDTVNVTLELGCPEEEPTTQVIQVQIPEDARDGDLQIILGDAATYTPLALAAQPGLTDIETVDDLISALEAINGFSPRAVYIAVPSVATGLSIDGNDMPDLPGSRAALLTAGAAQPQPIQQFHTQTIAMPRVIVGSANVRLQVKQPVGAR
ncbi:MAG: SpoIVB peptidase S55 domain-containing protein [Phycisphaerales bacterium JB063]